MGHIHLGVLPQTKKWQQVVGLLETRAPIDEIAAASATAAERHFQQVADHTVLVNAVRLLALVPQAARSGKFAGALAELGLDVPAEPTIIDLTEAAARSLDRIAAVSGENNDFAELVRRAFSAALSEQLRDRVPSLFSPNAADVQFATRELSKAPQFSGLARDFFTRLVAGSLSYYLSRVLSAQVGPGRRFETEAGRNGFDAALDQYCWEASRIIREFASGWYSKSLYLDGTITERRAAQFSVVSLKKIREELLRKRDADD